MARKIRTQIYLDPDQDRELRKHAKELGISKAELIRRIISRPAASYPTRPEAWQDELRFLAEKAVAYGSHPEEPQQIDLQAWEESKKVIRERMKLKVPQTGRTWTREELYEERLERLTGR